MWSWARVWNAADVRIGRGGIARLALMTGAPVAVVAMPTAGSPALRWVNRAMADLLGIEHPGDVDVPLADVVADGHRERVVAAARDLVSAGGQSANVQVATAGASSVWFHLLAPPLGPVSRLLAATRLPVRRRAILHARLVDVAWPAAAADAQRQLSDRLGAALLRLRRHPSRVAVAMVWVRLRGDEGLRPAPDLETRSLAERVRAAARDTDTVVLLGPGHLGLLVEDSGEGGEVAMGRRVLAVVDRAVGDVPHPVVTVAVLEVADPDVDRDAVIGYLSRTAGSIASQGGLVVLPAWVPLPPDRSQDPNAPTDSSVNHEYTRRALSSGHFVLGQRTVRRMSGGDAPGNGGGSLVDATDRLPVLLEVCTIDNGNLSPVRVSAPGLAAAIDHWALERLAVLDLPDAPVALRLQPAGRLTNALGDAANALVAQRPGLRLGLQVPEDRLEEAIAAQRTALRALRAGGVEVGVSDWTGRIDVPTLVRADVGLIELSASCQRAVAQLDGAALVAGLVAGLRAGLGARALIVAEDLGEELLTSVLNARGIVWATPSPALMMSDDDGEPKQTGSGRARRDVRRSP